MQPIIEPQSKSVLETELHSGLWIRKTNNGENDIYIFKDQEAPHVLLEIGRLREITFRAAGGGTGKALDLDEFDSGPNAYRQLLVWNPRDKEIVGAYRFMICSEALMIHNQPCISTAHFFKFSTFFLNSVLPKTIELGRSFIQPAYQLASGSRKGLYSLDNLWDGLGALYVDYPQHTYFFGKVTMYTSYPKAARDLVLNFMLHYFPDTENWAQPHQPIANFIPSVAIQKQWQHLNYKSGHAKLSQDLRAMGTGIPPLINAYMNLSPSMKMFGTALNPNFGNVEETGILVHSPDIYSQKKDRHILTYKSRH
ncbi:MAG: hypothetical protein RIR05_860 [Bacteroidota bacterium]|jgi:hypothetical protein|nr:GNAT family N-acetyltransferase [Bacteroidia bacterium]NBY10914.1 GNAT family N-acetyltransferase [Sphingobacteriia bacterium]